MAFKIDMSPLERSSQMGAQALTGLGQNIGQGIMRSAQNQQVQADKNQQSLRQSQIQGLMQAAVNGDAEALNTLYTIDPESAKSIQGRVQGLDDEMSAEKLKANQDTLEKVFRLQSMPESEKAVALQELMDNPNDDFDESDLPYIDDPKNLNAMAVKYFGEDDAKAMFGVGMSADKSLPAETVAFNKYLEVAQNPNSTQLEKDSARRALGDLANKSSSAQIQIASNPELAAQVAESEAKIAKAKSGATEAGKLKQQLKFRPQITKALKLAEKAAIEEGDVLNDLGRMNAALPGVRDAVSQLKDLAPLTTTTWGGKVWDEAVKQTGFGATKGSTARAKFRSIIDNQVLPLLKPTFGGSFSVQEGESLKATLGDIDASAEEKLATLDAFINQKERDIKSKEGQLSQEQQVVGGNRKLSDEELLSKYGG